MNLPPRAACLTPPAIGGIAVIEVVGDDAPALVSRHLRRSGRAFDLGQMSPHDLRLCRLMDGEEVIDDVIVCLRRSSDGTPVVDLNLHGGARIVQRVLLLLQHQSVQIVEPSALIGLCWPASTALHADAIELIHRAPTRKVAVWLAQLPDRLAARMESILEHLASRHMVDARRMLRELLSDSDRLRLMLGGVRVVLIGRPNSGKSTLANALAEQERAIVSELPGTTRDWTEHPAAIEGVPFTFVDTAGIRHTHDPIEAEAIRRARQEISRADLVIRVMDLTAPPDMEDEELATGSELTPILDVYNKADLPAHPDHRREGRTTGGIRVSAMLGEGIDSLRAHVLEMLGVPAGSDWPIAPFTERQCEACQQAYDVLGAPVADTARAATRLENLLAAAVPGRPDRQSEV